MKNWMVFNIGCIECGVSSDVVGLYETYDEAKAVADKLDEVHSWRQGGQNSYEVFDLSAEPNPEYVKALMLEAKS